MNCHTSYVCTVTISDPLGSCYLAGTNIHFPNHGHAYIQIKDICPGAILRPHECPILPQTEFSVYSSLDFHEFYRNDEKLPITKIYGKTAPIIFGKTDHNGESIIIIINCPRMMIYKNSFN